VTYEPAYPEEVSAEALSDEDVSQQDAAHGHAEGAEHAHGDDQHSHGEGADHDHGQDH
jgi:hypothetical protein